MSQNRDSRFAFAGDLILTHPCPLEDHPRRTALRTLLLTADLACANLEMLFHDHAGHPAAQSGGSWFQAPPSLLDEVRDLGFGLLALPNNHSLDFGTEALLEHLAHVEASGLGHAGLGRDLQEARRPAYRDSPGGRIALIACTADFTPPAPAGLSRSGSRGRPGVNPLRYQTIHHLDRVGMKALRTIREQLQPGAQAAEAGPIGFLGQWYALAEVPGTVTVPHPEDWNAILTTIRQAREQADHVFVSLHAHRGSGGDRRKPAGFIEAFARSAIEAGADVFFGHGPHVLRGVEIHRDRPIFYSLGNFFNQWEPTDHEPCDYHLSLGLGPGATPRDLQEARSRLAGGGEAADELPWESVIAMPVFRTGRLVAVELYPVGLGRDLAPPRRGTPERLHGAEASRVLKRLQRLSAAYGTAIAIESDRGLIRSPEGP